MTSASYYRDVNKDSTTREKEFVKNKDWDEVKKTIYDSLVPKEHKRRLVKTVQENIFLKVIKTFQFF